MTANRLRRAKESARPAERDQIDAFEGGGKRELLLRGLWGFEREALRVDVEGRIATTEHPFSAEEEGITVDFGESQIELVTKPWPTIEGALAELGELHARAYGAMGEELLWPLSVPGRWDEPERFRPASFAGASAKEGARQYRRYLLGRYGRARQAISGLHYNFSLAPELWDFLRRAELSTEEPRAYRDRRYMELARNFLRYRFLPVFLFGASPAIDGSFERELQDTAGLPAGGLAAACAGRFASLRLGPLGYRLDPRTASLVDLRFDSLEEYLDKLEAATVRAAGGESLLRSASEYYAPLRLKAQPGVEKGGLRALREKGIDYLELRIFDLDPFAAVGIGAGTARFVQLFALACLLMPSPRLERGAADDDPLSFASSSCSYGAAGRAGRVLLRGAIAEASKDLMRRMSRIARLLPAEYGEALEAARETLAGRRPRPVEAFAALAARSGGALAAGLGLAREHRARILGDAAGGAGKEGVWTT
jgi:glutamate--cysteine ligase